MLLWLHYSLGISRKTCTVINWWTYIYSDMIVQGFACKQWLKTLIMLFWEPDDLYFLFLQLCIMIYWGFFTHKGLHLPCALKKSLHTGPAFINEWFSFFGVSLFFLCCTPLVFGFGNSVVKFLMPDSSQI